METKIGTKREYVIILTQEEAEILYDALETIPGSSSSKKIKVSEEVQKRINFTDDLFDNVCNLLESEE